MPSFRGIKKDYQPRKESKDIRIDVEQRQFLVSNKGTKEVKEVDLDKEELFKTPNTVFEFYLTPDELFATPMSTQGKLKMISPVKQRALAIQFSPERVKLEMFQRPDTPARAFLASA
ncbi:hypothetical protein DPMN_060091 [Dreissena polymorpha]|uniref:Uncharacterized protein n=1 Tax=Dreissena polymorpha TaxID=45954 RepID=A0A9D4C4K7_DREPO|nr:hypothetical protein DPMN_060091 [Dreissena polymorpha]